MKTLRHWLMAALCVSLAAACGSDDEPAPGNNNPELPHGKRLTRIYDGIENGDWNKWRGDEYEYDAQGRLSKIWRYYEGVKGDDGKVHSFYYDDAHTVRMTFFKNVYTYTLNDEGYAVSMVKSEGETGRIKYTEYTYTSDGHLEGIAETYSDGALGPYRYTYTWEDGNMVSMKYQDGKSSATDCTYTFEYDTAQPNTYGILPHGYYSEGRCYPDEEAFYAGLLGKPTKHLPVHYSLTFVTGIGRLPAV